MFPGDGLPEQICVQCLLQVSRAYTLLLQCKKSDALLRAYREKKRQEYEEQKQEEEEEIRATQQSSQDIMEQSQLVIEFTPEQFIQLNCGDSFGEAVSSSSQSQTELLQEATLQLYPLQNDQQQQQPQQQQIEPEVAERIVVEEEDEDSTVAENGPDSSSPTYHSDAEMPDANSIYGIVLDELNSMAAAAAEEAAAAASEQQINSFGSSPSATTATHSQQISAFVCLKCQMSYESLASLERHQEKAHPLTRRIIECDICGKTFPTQKKIRRHMKIHSTTKPHACTSCSATFADSSNLSQHLKRHTGELRNVEGKPLSCKDCGKRFKWPSSLYKHRKLHTGLNLHRCLHCPKVFSEAKALQLHIRTHTRELPFTCGVCGHRFSQSTNLKRHMRVHDKWTS